jgi:hypothetical protein
MDQRMSKFVLRDERTAGGTPHDQNVEPAGVIADQERVPSGLPSSDLHPRSTNPRGNGKEPPRPVRAPKQQLGHDMDGAQDSKQQEQSDNAQGGARVQTDCLTARD